MLVATRPSYREFYQRSLTDPQAFWAQAAGGISWIRRWTHVLDDSAAPFYRWFRGGVLNTCYNCLDRHVESGRGGQIALVYDSPLTDQVKEFSYAELLDMVSRFAGVLSELGVRKGQRVLIYMPMVPEAAVAMLACARIGAVHSVVFGGFAPHELVKRIDDAKPKVIVSASCGIEPQRIVPYKPLLDEAIALAANKPEHCVILQRPQLRATLVPERDLDWHGALAAAPRTKCVPVWATDPLYILYTSGTTGVPKGVVRDNGGHAVALHWSMKAIYNVDAGDVFWAASDIGWVVGHSYIVYGPLLRGCTSILYEGKPVGTPDAGAYWRVISQHRVRTFFTAPTAFRAIKRDDPQGDLVRGNDLSEFHALFLAGERCDPDTLQWAERHLGVPVIDHWWQTESGWPMAANCLGIEMLPIKPGSPACPVPGFDVRVVDAAGGELSAREIGNIVVKLPLPPGCLPTLWKNDADYSRSYLERYPGYYLTGDAGYFDADGYLFVMARIDDIINVAGHRLSTGGMEEVLSSHPDVAECAVVGVADSLKGELPVGFVVLKSGVHRPHEDIAAELVRLVRERIGPVAAFRRAIVVPRLPKTRSGKVLRGTIKKIAEGRPYTTPATIEDADVLKEISAALA